MLTCCTACPSLPHVGVLEEEFIVKIAERLPQSSNYSTHFSRVEAGLVAK
jgi:hypothetical protein